MPSKVPRHEVEHQLKVKVEALPQSYTDCVAVIATTAKVQQRQAKYLLVQAVKDGVVFHDEKRGLYLDRPGRSVGRLPDGKPVYRNSPEYVEQLLKSGADAFLRASDEIRSAISTFVEARMLVQHLQDQRSFLDRVEAAFRPDWSFADEGREYFLPISLTRDPMLQIMKEHLGERAPFFQIWRKLQEMSPASGSSEGPWIGLVEKLLAEVRRLRTLVSYPGKCQVCRSLYVLKSA